MDDVNWSEICKLCLCDFEIAHRIFQIARIDKWRATLVCMFCNLEAYAFVLCTHLGDCDTEYAHNTALKIGTALVNYYVPLAVMAVLYGRIFVAIRRRSKLEIWQNAVVMAGGGHSSSIQSNAAASSRLLNSTKHEDGDEESDAEEIGSGSRVTDQETRAGGRLRNEAASRQPPLIVVDRVQSTRLSDCRSDQHGSRLHTDDVESAPTLPAESGLSSPVVEHRKCVRFLLVKQHESESNDDDLIEMSSVDRSHCDVTGNECSDAGSRLPARLMHRLRGRSAGDRRRGSALKQNSLSSDVKAAKQLGVIMGAFCMCFLPYFVCFVVVAVCRQCVDDRFMTTVTWIGYVNSTLNPFLYPLCNQQFRVSFRRMFASVQRIGAARRTSVALSSV